MDKETAQKVLALLPHEDQLLARDIGVVFGQHNTKLAELESHIKYLTELDPAQKSPVFQALVDEVLKYHARNKDLSRVLTTMVASRLTKEISKVFKETVDEIKKDLEADLRNL